MIKQYKQIFAGFFFLLGLACLVFFALSTYMDGRTAQDVRRIAHVHLKGILDQEKDRFEAIKVIRRTQMNSLKDALRRLDIGADSVIRIRLSGTVSREDYEERRIKYGETRKPRH